MLRYIKNLELVDIILVGCWIISSITSLVISRNWFLEGYYIPFTFNIGITVITMFILNILSKLHGNRSNFTIKDHMYIICKSLFGPLKLLYPKKYSVSSNNYFKSKEIEIDCFTVYNGGVIVKSVFFYIYSRFFDIGNVDTLSFKLLFFTETINIFLAHYIRGRSINKSVGLYLSFSTMIDISILFLLPTIMDYTLLVNLILLYILILMGNMKYLGKNISVVTILHCLSGSLFRVSYINTIIFSHQQKDGIFYEDSEYKCIWNFISIAEGVDLQVKLKIVKDVIAEKIIAQSHISFYDLIVRKLSHQLANEFLKVCDTDEGCLITDIITILKCKSIYYIMYLFVISHTIAIIYPIFVFNSKQFLANYFMIVYIISLFGSIITFLKCIPFIKFAYYSRFMTRLPTNLRLYPTDENRMKDILSCDIKAIHIKEILIHSNILPNTVCSIIAEYQKEEFIDLRCNECILVNN